jgi:hypothetical protein
MNVALVNFYKNYVPFSETDGFTIVCESPKIGMFFIYNHADKQ